MDKPITVVLSGYKGDDEADATLLKLLTEHLTPATKPESIVQKLKEGKKMTINVPQEGAATFFMGLENYEIKHTIRGNEAE